MKETKLRLRWGRRPPPEAGWVLALLVLIAVTAFVHALTTIKPSDVSLLQRWIDGEVRTLPTYRRD